MRRRRFLAAAGFSLMAIAASAAQSPASRAWFGADLPHGLGDPHRPIVDTSALKPAPAVVPAGEERNRELEGPAIRRYLEQIVGISRADRARGEKAWGRITGFRGADETHRWVAEQFSAAGLRDVKTDNYTATAATWHPRSWEVRLLASEKLGAGSRDVVLESAFPTSGSRIEAGTLTAPLVSVGAVTDSTRPDVDVRGRIAVQRLHPQAGAFSERTRATARARELAQRGAVAVLNVIEQAGNMHVRDFSNCGVPCFNIGTDDGRFVEEVMQRASAAGALPELRARINLQVDMPEGLVGHNTIGTVAGRRTDELVIVNAHADG